MLAAVPLVGDAVTTRAVAPNGQPRPLLLRAETRADGDGHFGAARNGASENAGAQDSAATNAR